MDTQPPRRQRERKGDSNYMPRERLLLLYKFLIRNASREVAVPYGQITDYLASEGIVSTNRRLYADIAILNNALDLGIRWDPRKHGYIMENPPFEPGELRLMVDSIQSAKFITREQADKLSHKIAEMSDAQTRATLNRQSLVADRVGSMSDSVMKDTDKIHAAMDEDCQVGFRYSHYTPSKERKYSKSGSSYIVSPFALLWSDGYYYLYAYVAERRRFQYFRVDRMDRVSKLSGKRREGKELFNKSELTSKRSGVFNMFTGPEHTVRFRCINTLADVVIDRFGRDTLLIPDGDQHFTFSAQIEVSDAFYGWVSAFGRRMRIVSPEPVVNGMREFVSKINEMYQQEQR